MKFITKIINERFWGKKDDDTVITVETEQKIHLEDVEHLFQQVRVDVLSGVSSHDVTAVRLALRAVNFDRRVDEFSAKPGVIVALRTPEVQSVGLSRRDPLDKFDGEVAYLMALGRALESLGHKLTSRANSLVKHNDDIKVGKKEARSPAARRRFEEWQDRIHEQREERISVAQTRAASSIRDIATEKVI